MKTMILKNGSVYDPIKKEFTKRDIAAAGGKIVAADTVSEEGASVIDVDGCIVTPGLIDYHIHLYTGCDGGVKADLIELPNGVTTAVDGGTCGVSSFEMFAKTDIAFSTTRVLSYLHVAPEGLATAVYPERVDPDCYDVEKMKDMFARYPDILKAVKYRISKNIVSDSETGRKALIRSVEAAEEIGVPLVVHMCDPVIEPEEAAAILRPGDVFCHMYYGGGSTIVDENGRVKKGILQARERGVIFDACNGRGNFEFRTAIQAVRDGFYPDIISTDISPISLYMRPPISLPVLLSKYLAFGMSLPDVLNAAILQPAKQIGMADELATLDEGTEADIAVFKLVEKPMTFYDKNNDTITGDEVLVPMLTVRDGEICYRQSFID